jgi:hypothetical protein
MQINDRTRVCFLNVSAIEIYGKQLFCLRYPAAGGFNSFHDTSFCSLFLQLQADRSFSAASMTSPVYDEVFTASLIGGINYYHFLIEQLPQNCPLYRFSPP